MTLQPNTIENRLIEELCGYIADGRAPSEFEVARLKREATKLKGGNHASYACVLGMIACLDNDVEESKKQHELAIRLEGSVANYDAYCTSLYNIGCLFESYQWAEKGLNRFPYAPQLIKKAIKAAYFLCLFDKVVEHYQSLIPLQLPMIDEQTQGFFENAEVVLNLGIHRDSLHMLSNILENIRLKHHFDIRSLDLSLLNTEENQELFNWIGTSSDVDTTVEMNMELCEILASQPNIDLGNMTVAFRACQH